MVSDLSRHECYKGDFSAEIRGAQSERLEKAMAPYSSTPAWQIPWTEEPGRLQSMGSRKVGHDWVTSLEKAMAPHSSTLAWKIPWEEEPGRLQSMGSLGVGHDWATSLSLFTFMHWRGNGNPLQCSCLENPRDRGAWRAAVYGVTHSRTQLKRLSSSSSKVKDNFHTWVI